MFFGVHYFLSYFFLHHDDHIRYLSSESLEAVCEDGRGDVVGDIGDDFAWSLWKGIKLEYVLLDDLEGYI